MEEKISGLMIYYYFVCKRKLWYFVHHIAMEQNSELVSLGKSIDENAYPRQKKHISIHDEINIDFIAKNGMIHEVKKSRRIEEASIWQVKYYIYYLQQRGIEHIVGEIDYPLLRQTVAVQLSSEDIQQLHKIIEDILAIIHGSIPPVLTKGICRKCAYGDLCLI